MVFPSWMAATFFLNHLPRFHKAISMSKGLSSEENDLRRLARLHGIDCVYRDGCEKRRVVPLETLRYFLGLMNILASTKQEVCDSLHAWNARFQTQLIDNVMVVWLPNRTRRWLLTVPRSLSSLSSLMVEGVLENEAGHRTSFHYTGASLQPTSSHMGRMDAMYEYLVRGL